MVFQEVPREEFRRFKSEVRSEIDTPMLKSVLPIGTILKDVWWESFGDRIRKPEHVMNPKYRDKSRHGSPGVTFGRQIGAYPILVGVQYQIPLETKVKRDDNRTWIAKRHCCRGGIRPCQGHGESTGVHTRHREEECVGIGIR